MINIIVMEATLTKAIARAIADRITDTMDTPWFWDTIKTSFDVDMNINGIFVNVWGEARTECVIHKDPITGALTDRISDARLDITGLYAGDGEDDDIDLGIDTRDIEDEVEKILIREN